MHSRATQDPVVQAPQSQAADQAEPGQQAISTAATATRACRASTWIGIAGDAARRRWSVRLGPDRRAPPKMFDHVSGPERDRRERNIRADQDHPEQDAAGRTSVHRRTRIRARQAPIMKKGVSWWLTVETVKMAISSRAGTPLAGGGGRGGSSPGLEDPEAGRRCIRVGRTRSGTIAGRHCGSGVGEPVDQDGQEDEVEQVVERLRREVVLAHPVADDEQEAGQPPRTPGDPQVAHDEEQWRQAEQVDGHRPYPQQGHEAVRYRPRRPGTRSERRSRAS